MARIFLHVGTMKSGTSYVQRLCNLNQERLADDGIDWHGVKTVNRAVQDLLRMKRAHPQSQGAWQRLAQTVRTSPRDTLISMELLGPAPAQAIARVGRSLEGHELHLVITARDVTRVLPSHWQELTQNRGEKGWREYTEQVCADPGNAGQSGSRFWRHHDIMQVVERWSTIVPASRTSIVTVPPSGSDPSLLWTRFASVMGVPDSGYEMPRTVNPSVGAVSAELMLRLNERSRDWAWQEYRLGLKTALAKRTLAGRRSTEPRYELTAEQHRALREWTLRSNRAIAAAAVTVVGSLDDLVAPEAPREGDFTPELVTDSMLLEAALDGLAGVSRKYAALALRNEELERGRETALGSPTRKRQRRLGLRFGRRR